MAFLDLVDEFGLRDDLRQAEQRRRAIQAGKLRAAERRRAGAALG